MPQQTPARLARLRAGLDLADAARRARISPEYLAACERRNSFAYVLAQRLARMYRASVNDFLPRPADGGTAAGAAQGPRRSAGGRVGGSR